MKLKLLIVSLFASLGLMGAVGEPQAQYRPSLEDLATDKGVMDTDRCIARRDQTRSSISRCTYGKPGSKRTVVLIGDSHALQYGPAMIRIAEKRGWRLIALMRQSCVIADVNYEKVCNTWRKDAMRKITRRIRPDMVVLSNATSGIYRVTRNGRELTRRKSQPYLERGMIRNLKRFRRAGAKVAVIQDQEIVPFGFEDCLAEKPKDECSFRRGKRNSRGPFDAIAARSVKGSVLIDPLPKLCPGGTCPVAIGNTIIYRDIYHLSATYAATLVPWLNRRLPNPG